MALSLAKTQGEGASSAERKRVRKWSLFSKNKIQCLYLDLFLMFFSFFWFFSLLVTFLSYEVSLDSERTRHLIRTYYTGDKLLFRKQKWLLQFVSELEGNSHVLVKVISQCQWFRNGLWNVNKGEKRATRLKCHTDVAYQWRNLARKWVVVLLDALLCWRLLNLCIDCTRGCELKCQNKVVL